MSPSPAPPGCESAYSKWQAALDLLARTKLENTQVDPGSSGTPGPIKPNPHDAEIAELKAAVAAAGKQFDDCVANATASGYKDDLFAHFSGQAVLTIEGFKPAIADFSHAAIRQMGP